MIWNTCLTRWWPALVPKALLSRHEAGLLTYSFRSAAFPSLTECRLTVANWQTFARAYSSGNCTGFSPDSLLSLSAPHIGCKSRDFFEWKREKCRIILEEWKNTDWRRTRIWGIGTDVLKPLIALITLKFRMRPSTGSGCAGSKRMNWHWLLANTNYR